MYLKSVFGYKQQPQNIALSRLLTGIPPLSVPGVLDMTSAYFSGYVCSLKARLKVITSTLSISENITTALSRKVDSSRGVSRSMLLIFVNVGNNRADHELRSASGEARGRYFYFQVFRTRHF